MVVLTALLVYGGSSAVRAEGIFETVVPEQRHLMIRDPSQMQQIPLPDVPAPVTVASPNVERDPRNLSLDEALCIALTNSEVIRVLAGTGASSSGSTIYDPAITNTQIDTARAAFDPVLRADNLFDQAETPGAVADATAPHGYRIGGTKSESYSLDFGLSKQFVTGAVASVGSQALDTRTTIFPPPAATTGLNPLLNSTVSLGITQPLLQGGGIAANLAPIQIARLNTERSFFQMKDNVQQMVRGVIEAYWLLVAARVDVWARQQQVAQGREVLLRAEAGVKTGMASFSVGDVAQARTSLAGFQASLITAQADLLQREAALRNILGLPPVDRPQMVPVTPPRTSRYEVAWEEVLRMASEYRPDLIELKLVLEADQQQLVQANNSALPQLDATASYRWNGMEGRTPDMYYIGTEPGEFAGWTLGVNFSVPLGLRAGRAQLRDTELLIMRDRANLRQGLHNASHLLATNYRNLDRYYEQYKTYQEAHKAAQINLEYQLAAYRTGRSIFLNVLQAIIDWGNSAASEAGTLALYNTELANLQAQSGMILEAHGIRFVEERYCSIGPMGRLFPDRRYPEAMQPGPNRPQYETTDKPAEDIFDLSEVRDRLAKPSKADGRKPEAIPSPQPSP